MYFILGISVHNRAYPRVEGCRPPVPLKSKLKKTTDFVDTIIWKPVTWFTLQPKSVAEICWWPYIRILKNKIEKLRMSYTKLTKIRNKVKCQLDATRYFYWCILNSTCFGYICPSSGALDVELQHLVFHTEFLDGWWSWEPLRRSCVRCGWCRAPSCTRNKSS